MEKQQAQYIADYINHERDNADTAWLEEWEVDSRMILDALDTWKDQQDIEVD